MIRKNGFKRPFHKLQIISWVYVIGLFGIFSFMVLPIQESNHKILISSLYALTLLTVLFSGFLCTASDPTDPALKESHQANILSKPIDYKKYPKICKICKNHVNQDTKHCRECNRCVFHFDHHCKWLNNCIGKRNYKFYSILLTSFEIHNLIIAFTGGFTLKNIINKGNLYSNLQELISSNTGQYEFYITLLVIMELMSVLAGVAMIQLLSFHTFLAIKGITTYEYILSRRKRSEQYKVSSIKVVNENEIIEEIPLEDVYEPYVENPQYKPELKEKTKGNKVVPRDEYTHKEQSSSDNLNESMKIS